MCKTEKLAVSIIGAAGRMGLRSAINLAKHSDMYELMLVERSASGIERLKTQGFETVSVEEALSRGDIIVFSIPDSLIKTLSAVYVPQMKSGAGLIILDPSSAIAKELTMRDDCSFSVAHPCHPSFLLEQDSPEARHDRFGAEGGKQDVVASFLSGDRKLYLEMNKVVQIMLEAQHVYDMTVEQMAFLEPTMVEVLGATCIYAMKETLEEAVRRGVDRDAAVSFLTGHIYNLTCNFLGYIPGNPSVSDACLVAMDVGKRVVLRENWKDIWDDQMLKKVVATMLHPDDRRV